MLDCLNTPELLISNPPYIDPDVKLEANVANFEPHTALFAPNKGLEILFNILDLIKLKNIPFAICEMGYNQKEQIAKYAKEIGLSGNLEFYKDLAGLDRGFVFKSNIS
jgi:release factor glutamine methyltransferase